MEEQGIQLKYKNPKGEIVILTSKSNLGIFHISTGELRTDFFGKLKKSIEDPAFIVLKDGVYHYIRPFISGTIVFDITISNKLIIESVNTETAKEELMRLVQENEIIYVKEV